MTKEEALELLRAYANLDNPEEAHILTDRVLCDLLVALGYEEVVNEFHKIEKWYS